MPIFDFRCDACDTKVEKMVRTHQDRPCCESCNKPMDKLVSAPRASGYKLVGAGFYKNDGTIDELRSIQKQSEANEKRLKGG